MKLLTKEIEKQMPRFHFTEVMQDNQKRVIVKFFTPWTSWTWWVIEGEKQDDGDWLFFGLVDGHERELGYFSLSELQAVNGPFGLKIERDLHFGEHFLSEFLKENY